MKRLFESVWLTALIFGGAALAIWGCVNLVHDAQSVETPAELVELIVGALIGLVGMTWLYRWWSTR